MECTLLFLAACLMFSGVHGESQSMSCSTVNGKTICNKQTSEGNSAMASSAAQFGRGSTYQGTYAGAGNPGQWDYSSQTVRGLYPPGPNSSPIFYDYYDYQETPGSFGESYIGGFSNDYPDPGMATIFGGPFGASGFAFSPNVFSGAQAGGGAFAGGGFAVAGNIPFASPGDDYSIEDYDSFGGAPAQGRGFAGPMPAPSNPFEFVNRFMGRGPVVGGFAAAGAFPFGRR